MKHSVSVDSSVAETDDDSQRERIKVAGNNNNSSIQQLLYLHMLIRTKSK